MGEDDRQELGWQELQPLKQMRLRLDRGDRGRRRREEIAQPVDDSKPLGSLLVGKAPRGEMAVRSHGAQSGEREGGHRGRQTCMKPLQTRGAQNVVAYRMWPACWYGPRPPLPPRRVNHGR